MKKLWIVIIFLALLCIALSIIAYPYLPDKIDSHWDTEGNVNGNMGKLLGTFLIPLIIIGILILFSIIPKIDPLRENIKKFYNYYLGFVFFMVLFLSSIQFWIILWNLGIMLNSNFIVPLAVGIMFLYLGFLLEKTKRNWFIGIRTPWTLSSDFVWEKTHILGGKLFFISGILILIGIFFEKYTFWFILLPIIVSAIILIIYSYLLYRKLPVKKRK